MHPQRSVITRALGTEPDVDVDAFTVAAEPGDVYLLCSDGLSDMVDDETIAAVVGATAATSTATAKALVQAANRGGGEDNITAVLFEIVGDDDAASRRRSRTTTTPEYAPRRPTRRHLHPEDGDARDRRLCRRRSTTMVVSAAEIETRRSLPRRTGSPTAASRRRLLALLVILAADRAHRRARLVGARSLIALPSRNRELLYLVAVGAPHRLRLRDRVHRAAGARQLGLARLRDLLPRAVPRCTHRRARTRCPTPTRTSADDGRC